MPELPVLSPVDISQDTTGWVCEPLTFEQALSEGEHFVYELAKVTRWLGDL